MRIRCAFCITFLVWLVGACVRSDATEQDSADGEGPGVVSTRLPPFPEESLLCDIVYNESTPAEVAAVLGEPGDTHDSGNGSLNFFYEYEGATLFIGFIRGVFVDAMVDNAPYPSCWTAQEAALNEALERLRKMPMNN